MKICSIDGCNVIAHARGWCHKHYKRWQTHEDATFCKVLRYDKPSFEVLMDNFKNNLSFENKCWEWHGRLTRAGYGHVFYKGSTKTAHRISYKYFKGEIPKKMNVCHICDNKKCFNPNHLWLGTTQENIQDAYDIGLIIGKRGSKNPMSKLKEYQIIEIRKLIKEGKANTEIAKIYGVIHQTISLIKHNKIWNHVK